MTSNAVVQKELARPSAERLKQAFRSVKGLIEPDAHAFGHDSLYSGEAFPVG